MTSSMKNVPLDVIPVRRKQDGGVTRMVQYVKCSHTDCQKEVSKGCTGSLNPPHVFKRIAEGKGWQVDFNQNRHLCPDHKPKRETMTTDTKEPTCPPVMRRKIFRALDDAYDEKKQRYVDGFDDKMIAADVGTTWGWVAKLREENFGPAGPDPEIGKALEAIAKLERTAKTVEEMGMRAAEQAEKLATEIAQIKARVECLK